MTYREEPPEAPECPRCRKNDRVIDIIPAKRPDSEPPAPWECCRCVLTFTGLPGEAFALQARDAARAAERGDLDRRGQVGRELGVLHPKDGE